jgi:hypothetical protein
MPRQPTNPTSAISNAFQMIRTPLFARLVAGVQGARRTESRISP